MTEKLYSYLTMIKKPGFILIEPNGVDHCAGFQFDYGDDRFDGCHAGQNLPLAWAYKILGDKIASLMVDPNSHGIEPCNGYGETKDEELADEFSGMVMYAIFNHFEHDKDRVSEFIDELSRRMRRHPWLKD